MNRKLMLSLLPAAALLVSAPLRAESGLRCEATLTGAQETANVDVPGSGKIVAVFDAGFTGVDVVLKLRDVPTASRLHFHCNRPGANGPIALGLVDPGPFVFERGVVRGTLFNEDFSMADCVPSVARPVNNVASLAFAMRDGLIYANVHTPENPGGEVRGQMQCRDHGD